MGGSRSIRLGQLLQEVAGAALLTLPSCKNSCQLLPGHLWLLGTAFPMNISASDWSANTDLPPTPNSG